MAYKDHFILGDDLITHLDTVVGKISDPFISSRYVGFVAVAAVTVYELAIKDIFMDFAIKKHKVLGAFTTSYFDRINGRIQIRTLREDYIKRFGEKYVKRFLRNLDQAEIISLRVTKRSIINSYTNIITWRNDFAHEGKIPATVTYNEITAAFNTGKEVITTLAATMRY